VSEHSPEKDARCCGHIIGNICPACLLNPCECPVDDSAARALFASVIPPDTGDR
jgi:hypothetical protein